MQVNTVLRFHLSTRMAVIKKITIGEAADKRELSCTGDRIVIYYRHYKEESGSSPTKPQIDLPYYLALLILDIYPQV